MIDRSKLKYRAVILTWLVFAMLFPAVRLFAHGIRVQVEMQSPFIVVKARYHGSKALADAPVSIRFANKTPVFQKGKTDKTGSYRFKPGQPGQWRITVDDLMGHRKTESITIGQDFFPPAPTTPASVPDDTGKQEPKSKQEAAEDAMWGYLIKAIIGVLLILAITVVMQRRQKRQESNK